jgi:hypothetical protein
MRGLLDRARKDDKEEGKSIKFWLKFNDPSKLKLKILNDDKENAEKGKLTLVCLALSSLETEALLFMFASLSFF